MPTTELKKEALFVRVKFIIEYFFVKALVELLALLPLSRAQSVGKKIGRFINFLLPSRYRIARKNLQDSFPGISEEKVRTIVESCWEGLGQGLGLFVKMPHSVDAAIGIGEAGIEIRKQSPATAEPRFRVFRTRQQIGHTPV